ncbi:conserved Plasmodium protein, unknown function [Plasmodium gallinaceum]|uniref:Uncharacterized protein n=1 Tax=Plasmodium gallinaceum TaxID=5849 RepID=A0A1J1GRL8_PLAGA|nr:conserved Plasmodium protein, unknown function [Plasmodium gallinaceum]CRG95175.1 conserved Plasmodium protein, unknown function [Plasmodium gallinaceum]
MMFENSEGNDKKKRKLYEDTSCYEYNKKYSNYLNPFNNNDQINNYSNFYFNENASNIYRQNNAISNFLNLNNDNIQFDKNLLINSIDIILNFINYNNLNDTVKHEILHENLLNLRFHIMSLNDDKFNQKKITEYFSKI